MSGSNGSGPGDGFRPFLFASAVIDAAAKGEHPPLSVYAVSLLWAIARHAHNASGHCKLGTARAIGLTGISGKTQLRRARGELIRAQLISFAAGSGRRASDYWLNYAALKGRHLPAEGYQGGTPATEVPQGSRPGTAEVPDGHPGGTAQEPRTTVGTPDDVSFSHSRGGGREGEHLEKHPDPPPLPRRRDPRARERWLSSIGAWTTRVDLPELARSDDDLVEAVAYAIEVEEVDSHANVVAFLERWQAAKNGNHSGAAA